MSDWKTFAENPEGVFDILARQYDAPLNRFILRRFTDCIVQDLCIIWGNPFGGEAIDLHRAGFRPVRWRPAPGPEDIPADLDSFASGPADYAA